MAAGSDAVRRTLIRCSRAEASGRVAIAASVVWLSHGFALFLLVALIAAIWSAAITYYAAAAGSFVLDASRMAHRRSKRERSGGSSTPPEILPRLRVYADARRRVHRGSGSEMAWGFLTGGFEMAMARSE